MKKLLAVLACLIFIAGCATAGRKIDQTAVDKIKKGETTREDVRAMLGSPDNISKDATGQTTWNYLYVRSTVKGSTFIPLVGAFAGGVNMQQQSLSVTFGEDGKVLNFVSTSGGTDVGTGLEAGGKARLDETEKNKRAK